MINSKMELSIIVTFFSLVLLILVNKFVKDLKVKVAFNFLFFSESIVLTFFFEKFPFYLSILITVCSAYFLLRISSNRSEWFSQGASVFNYISSNSRKKLFPFLGLILIISVILYEYFGDWTFSSHDLLVISLSLVLIFHHKVPSAMRQEADFLLIFLSIVSFFFLFPTIFYKIISGRIGECHTALPGESCDSIDFFNETALVLYLLGKPLAIILSLLGYNVFVSGQVIFFEDMDAGIIQGVAIAKSCAGLSSIQIFMSALISYILIEYRRFDSTVAIIITLGLLIAYFANLMRMAIIIIVGHYWGIDTLLLVHEYAGWVIFTVWVFLFWIIINKVLGIPDTAET